MSFTFFILCLQFVVAITVIVGQSVSLFPLESVQGWKCWFTGVCAREERHHFLCKWFQSGKVCFRNQTPEVADICSEFNLENGICLQLNYFTLQSGTITRAELCDGWSERRYIHVEGIFSKIENLLLFSHITESGFKLTLQLLQNFNKSCVAELLLQEWLTCGCCSEFWEVDKLHRAVILFFERSYCPQHLTGRLVSSLELQVEVCSGER